MTIIHGDQVITDDSLKYVIPAKRSRLDTPNRRKLDAQMAGFTDWLDATEANLELLSNQAEADPSNQLSLEEQLVLIQVITYYTL